mgnify:FL=1
MSEIMILPYITELPLPVQADASATLQFKDPELSMKIMIQS